MPISRQRHSNPSFTIASVIRKLPIASPKLEETVLEDQLKQLSICIVNYNGCEYLPACLNSVIAACPIRQEIIVVDNASDDASVDLITREFPQVKLIRFSENLGPGAARKRGLGGIGRRLRAFYR